MREMILKAVANPPKILWGPFVPVMLNLGIQFPLMFMMVGSVDVNPLVFMTLIIIGHTFCIFLVVKEPHVSSMIQAYGKANKNSTNLYKVKGNKFAP